MFTTLQNQVILFEIKDSSFFLHQILHASEEHEAVIEEDIEDADWICCLDPVCGRWRHVTKNILDANEHTLNAVS